MLKKTVSAILTSPVVRVIILFVFSFALAGVLHLTDSTLDSDSRGKLNKRVNYALNCAHVNLSSSTCRRNYPATIARRSSTEDSCPDYFRWIYEDLRPWMETGITRDALERAQRTAHFRLIISGGKMYVVKYRKSIQTRDTFTIWGIMQLLRLYPGMLPDLELMFDCDDRPVVPERDFRSADVNGPPPLFRYCSDEFSMDIVFPDWSFWGWAEINIKPWKTALYDIKKGSSKTRWMDRIPYAYWRGNPHVATTRRDLLKCNVSEKTDWNTRLFIQDWIEEDKNGFKQSNLEDQCRHRYKIYIEGWAWSVSEKYILACDSITMFIQPHFHDFFTRGMLPLKHYWPIREDDKCRSLKFAVEWGNNHTREAEKIGLSGSSYIHDGVKIEYVYDYMFHLLHEYAKLLRFKPKVPPEVPELCPETMACPADGRWKKFMLQSIVISPADMNPCALPPPYDPAALAELKETRINTTRQVRAWESDYYTNHH